MDRRDFIKQCSLACAGIGALAFVLDSCTAVRYVNGDLTGNGLMVDIKDFTAKNGYRSYVIARHDALQYPICIYRLGDGTYNALLLQCTHQGAELQVSGDVITCPAHGSEFDKWGKATQAPAFTDLRSFPVTIVKDQLFIDLRKPA